MALILIVEDEKRLLRTLRDGLAEAGYEGVTSNNGEAALWVVQSQPVDLVVLDLMLPGLHGLEVLQRLRNEGFAFPVLILTACDQVRDRVAGLDRGADDYLVKPFSSEELLARVRAMLRRLQRQSQAPAQLALGDVAIDLAKQTATRGRKSLHLTAKEFAMLRLMAESPGEPVSRERFLDVVWGYAAFPTTRTVDNHIASLRAKLEPNPDEPRWLKTVHGVGYRLQKK